MSARTASLAVLAAALLGAALAVLRAEQQPAPSAPTALEATEAPLALTAAEALPVAPFELPAARGAAPVRYDRVLRIEGAGFYGTSFGPDVSFDGVASGSVSILGPDRLEAHVPEGVRGSVRVRVTVPDGRWVERVVGL